MAVTQIAQADVDKDQFCAFVRKTYPDVPAYARRRVGPDAADDVRSETHIAIRSREESAATRIRLLTRMSLAWQGAARAPQHLPQCAVYEPTRSEYPR